jgi:outer membrane protein assembly factor BamB
MAASSLLYIGINGHAIALDRATGVEIWRTPLKGDFVNVVELDGALYATGSGELFCLDPFTGNIRWHNPLKGLGRGLVSIAAGGHQAVLAREKMNLDEAAAAGAAATATG